MSWFHRITFEGMAAAMRVLKEECHRLHGEAINERDELRRTELRARAEKMNTYANEFKDAYYERQGKP